MTQSQQLRSLRAKCRPIDSLECNMSSSMVQLGCKLQNKCQLEGPEKYIFDPLSIDQQYSHKYKFSLSQILTKCKTVSNPVCAMLHNFQKGYLKKEDDRNQQDNERHAAIHVGELLICGPKMKRKFVHAMARSGRHPMQPRWQYCLATTLAAGARPYITRSSAFNSLARPCLCSRKKGQIYLFISEVFF